MDRSGFCLLSLDGGGVRGLATLFVLKKIMNKLNSEREKVGYKPVKPCDVFHMMAGTSTGGLIAIMLGRLEMTVEECITEYTTLMKDVFSRNKLSSPVGIFGGVKSRFSSEALSQAIAGVLGRLNIPADEKFLVENPTCKVFVCAMLQKVGRVTRLRSYRVPEGNDQDPTILQAALATSAAPTYFSKVEIEGSTYIDGAIGANNPAEQLEAEANDILCDGNNNLITQVACFLSVGTGRMDLNSVSDRGVRRLVEALKKEATETEHTHNSIEGRWRPRGQESRYYRFNVDQGLNEVKLAEFNKRDTIQAGAIAYLDRYDIKDALHRCVQDLMTRQREFIDRGDAKKNLPAHQLNYQVMTEAIEQYNHALQRAKRSPETTPKELARIYQKLTQASIKSSILSSKPKKKTAHAKAAQEYAQETLKTARESQDESRVAQAEFQLAMFNKYKALMAQAM
ncbi:hypothetical protein E8E13_011166 [Curvularia kusanoi]|uniref:PNPLA domain-containing protein n=1 Tax=Curvularia kusanoi TaxID=90978 RepID=A0A9P4WDF8_CURKU|nr:hypothetical protein E8E13_011166 [Curvularia kusanoi]